MCALTRGLCKTTAREIVIASFFFWCEDPRMRRGCAAGIPSGPHFTHFVRSIRAEAPFWGNTIGFVPSLLLR